MADLLAEILETLRSRANGNEGTLRTELLELLIKGTGEAASRNPTAVLGFPLIFQSFFSAKASGE